MRGGDDLGDATFPLERFELRGVASLTTGERDPAGQPVHNGQQLGLRGWQVGDDMDWRRPGHSPVLMSRSC
ncbi:hypothetical protein ACWEVD_01525 [Nocardia thailandica]